MQTAEEQVYAKKMPVYLDTLNLSIRQDTQSIEHIKKDIDLQQQRLLLAQKEVDLNVEQLAIATANFNEWLSLHPAE